MSAINDALKIVNYSIAKVLPNEAVKSILKDVIFSDGKVILVAIGKAAYEMAKAAIEVTHIDNGIVISKYDHIKTKLANVETYEAGHPISDQNTFIASNRALQLTQNLSDRDTVLFLVSGGGSALFEQSDLSLEEIQDINNQLLKSGASINEINTIRKRLSNVKGGKFAKHCYPAKIVQIVLSDIINDPLDMIASGPAAIDSSTTIDALNIINKYNIKLSDKALQLINKDTIKQIDNVDTYFAGNLKLLCLAAQTKAKELGYDTKIIKTNENGIAKDAGKQFALLANSQKPNTCLIMGGETVVNVKGNGLGGRNQEFVLSASKYINDNVTLLSIGSDGTDGPTDAAGGFVNKEIKQKIKELSIDIDLVLNNNDAYNALKQLDALIATGPTGTNVNDLMLAIIE